MLNVCSAEGCSGNATTNGLCAEHCIEGIANGSLPKEATIAAIRYSVYLAEKKLLKLEHIAEDIKELRELALEVEGLKQKILSSWKEIDNAISQPLFEKQAKIHSPGSKTVL